MAPPNEILVPATSVVVAVPPNAPLALYWSWPEEPPGVPVPPPMQVPAIAKQPCVRLIPPVVEKVEVASPKLMPVVLPIEKREPGEVVATPISAVVKSIAPRVVVVATRVPNIVLPMLIWLLAVAERNRGAYPMPILFEPEVIELRPAGSEPIKILLYPVETVAALWYPIPML